MNKAGEEVRAIAVPSQYDAAKRRPNLFQDNQLFRVLLSRLTYAPPLDAHGCGNRGCDPPQLHRFGDAANYGRSI
jgi:hypothetical protein